MLFTGINVHTYDLFVSYGNMFCSFIRTLFECPSQYLQFQPHISAQRRPSRNSIGQQSHIGNLYVSLQTSLPLPRCFLLYSGTVTHCVYDRAYLKYKFDTTLLSPPPPLLCCLLHHIQSGPGFIRSGRTVTILYPNFKHHVSR